MVRMTGFEPAASLLRCPISSLPTQRLRQLSTAATRSTPLSRHRRWSSRSPKASTLLCSQEAADPSRQQKTKREPPTRDGSLFVVRMTGFEPAASCSQSKRSTKLSHIRILNDHKHFGIIHNIFGKSNQKMKCQT